MDADKRIHALKSRLTYIRDIFDGREDDNVRLLSVKLGEVLEREDRKPGSTSPEELSRLEDLFDFSERKLDGSLTPMDRVRIVRHPQRICLKDILENVYDNYTEIGGRGEFNIDPSMRSSRAPILRGDWARKSPTRWSWSSDRKKVTARHFVTADPSSRGAMQRRCIT